MRLPSSFAQHRILGGALVLSVTQFGASLAGLIRDNMLARTFPGLDTVDVYIAAFRPSDLLFQVTIMAGFSVALVPLLARHFVTDDRREMHALLNGVIAVAAAVFGVLALTLAFLFPKIAPFLVGFRGESLALYVSFARIALLTNFLFVFGNAYGQYLITVQRYWIYGLTPILYTLGTIAGTVLLTPSIGAYGPMVGTLAGAVFYVIVRLGSLIAWGYRPAFRVWHPELTELGWLMLPRMLALGALQLELLLFDALGSRLPAGAVTVNAYTRNFQSLVVGVVGIALAQSAFSLLSQAAAKKEQTRFRMYTRKGTIFLLALTIPLSILLVAVTPIAAWLVHLTSILRVFAMSLAIYAVSIPFESWNHLYLRSYFALKNTLMPSVTSMVSGLIAVGIAWMFLDRFGVASLAIGYTAGQILQLTTLAALLPRTTKKAFA